MWKYLGLPQPTKLQLDIAYNLQHAPRRFVLQAFRGAGKSWITVAFVAWLLFLNPQVKIMVVSANQNLADDFSKFTKQLTAGMPLLQHLQPRLDQRNSGISFDVGPATPSKDPSVKSVGITGQLTGSRADVIIGDDVEIPKNAYTHLLRQRLSEQVKEFDAVLKPNGRVIYLGTPQVEDSLYNLLAKDRGYTIKIWPARIPERIEIYRGRLAEYVVRRIESGWPVRAPLEPERFDEMDLQERELSYGRAGFALQFMLDTAPSDAETTPLRCRDLLLMDVDPEVGYTKVVWGYEKKSIVEGLSCGGKDGDCYVGPVFHTEEMAKFTGTVMAIDPSGQGKDETAYAIVRFLLGQLYLVDVGGFRDGFSERTLGALAAAALRHGVNYVIAEENYGGGMFNQLLKPVLAKLGAGGFDEEWDGWSRGQKELRILEILTPLVQSHRLVVSRRVIEQDLRVQEDTPQYSFVQQFTRMQAVKGALPHEDRLEAVAMACGYWVERMGRDQDKVLEAHKAQLLQKDLRRYHDHVFGRKPRQHTYVQRGVVTRRRP